MSSSADADATLEALISLSRHRAQRESRSTRIRSLAEDNIAQIISLGTKRKFTREGLEDILLVTLDVIAREEGVASGKSIDHAGDVKVKLDELRVRGLASSADSSPTALAVLEDCGKRDPDIREASDSTAKRARKEKDTFSDSGVSRPAVAAWPSSLTAPGHILSSPRVSGHLLYLDPTSWALVSQENYDGGSQESDQMSGIFSKSRLGFYVPMEMLSTKDRDEKPELHVVMPLELSVEICRKISVDYLQGLKSIERYGDMILYQARYLETASHCLSDLTIRRKRGPSTRVHSQGDLWSACDFCIDTRRLCLRMIKVNDRETEKVFFPLPPHLRIGKHWTDMGFYVQENMEETGVEVTA
ncbi:hypothetical protein G6011_11724 [Alternaria panax]|uniref:Uncharacterized protein n=1 Tax=Alternaria panax TaxID=48097 RepID=A0AAD4IEA8_9PLEO|nr:hypothetical protein G6011_11724 [Alternaria panax]